MYVLTLSLTAVCSFENADRQTSAKALCEKTKAACAKNVSHSGRRKSAGDHNKTAPHRRIGVRIYMAYDCAAAEDACNSSASRIHGRRQSTDIDGTVPSIVDLADFKGDWVQFLTGQACGDGPVQPSI